MCKLIPSCWWPWTKELKVVRHRTKPSVSSQHLNTLPVHTFKSSDQISPAGSRFSSLPWEKENTLVLLLLLLRSPTLHSRREGKYANIPPCRRPWPRMYVSTVFGGLSCSSAEQVVMNTRASFCQTTMYLCMYECMYAESSLPTAQPLPTACIAQQRLSLILLLFFWTLMKAVRHSQNAHTLIIYRQCAGRRKFYRECL